MENLAIERAAASPAASGRERWQRQGAIAATALVLAAIVARRWQQMGPYPTGLDGGQWLAFGRGLLGGVGRSTGGVYAPLVPLLTGLARDAFGPLLALRLVALLSFAAVLAAVVVVARLGLGWAAAITALIVAGSASAIVEPIAYGGYPQTLAFACLMVGCAALSTALHDFAGSTSSLCSHARASAGSSRLVSVSAASLAPREATAICPCSSRAAVITASLAFLGAALSHHVYGPLALACGAALWPLWAVDPATRGRRRAGFRLAVVALLPGSLVAIGLLLAFHADGYGAPLDASGLDRPGAFVYATREATPVWAVLLVAGIACVVGSSRRLGPLNAVCAAMMLVPGALFVIFPEARLMPPVLVGGLLATLRGAQPPRWSSPRAVVAPALASALLLATLVPAGNATANRYFAYYTELDRSLVDAAAVIQTSQPAGAVVVRADVRDWPIGWWLEGLTTSRVVVGSDSRWLGFPAERSTATLASAFFDRRLSGSELRALAQRTGVDLLVVREREWIGWQRWLAEPDPPVTVLFDDGETLVLRIASVQK